MDFFFFGWVDGAETFFQIKFPSLNPLITRVRNLVIVINTIFIFIKSEVSENFVWCDRFLETSTHIPTKKSYNSFFNDIDTENYRVITY